MPSINELWRKLSKPIYIGQRLEENLKVLKRLGVLVATLGTVMTWMNLVQHLGFVTFTTIVVFLCGVAIATCSGVLRKRRAAVYICMGLGIFLFTYYAISGANGGFAILWTMVVPLIVCYFVSVRFGILLSLYYEVLFIVLFYTPIREYMAVHYSQTFMNRFPILYFCGFVSTAIAMVQYHSGVRAEIESEQRIQAEVEHQTALATERTEQLQELTQEMIDTLASAIDTRDQYTIGHSHRVSIYASILAKSLGWREEEVESIRREGLLHDIGKIGIPDAVLNKPGTLTEEEVTLIRSHTIKGGDILAQSRMIHMASLVARHHHERWDGTGYPDRLQGEAIPLHARVVSIADAYDAMRSDRVYRQGLSQNEILREMERCRGTQFDPELLDTFLGLLRSGAIEELETSKTA